MYRIFEILDRVSNFTYRLALPPNVAFVHNVFKITMMRGYVADSRHIFALHVLDIEPKAKCEEKPLWILDRKENELRNKTILIVKVLWWNHTEERATCELETAIREKYQHLFYISRTKLLKEDRIVMAWTKTTISSI